MKQNATNNEFRITVEAFLAAEYIDLMSMYEWFFNKAKYFLPKLIAAVIVNMISNGASALFN